MKQPQSQEQDRIPSPESAFDPALLPDQLKEQLERPLGLNATPARVRTRQREIMDLLLGADPLTLPDRVAMLDEVLLDFEAQHPEPLASLHPWKENGLRSYLLIRGELTKASWLLGERESALEEQAMLLELDPGNHFFQREQMLTFLLAMEDWESLETELQDGKKGRKHGLLLRLLQLAIALGTNRKQETENQVKALRISHACALDFWSGRKELPIEIPLEADEGTREESILAAAFLRPFTPPVLYPRLRSLASSNGKESLAQPKVERESASSVSRIIQQRVKDQLHKADSTAKDPIRRLHHLRQALRRAESRITPATFARCRGHFSDTEETREYLEILLRLGLTLFEAGQIEEARAHLGRMMDLDKADAFGARAYLDGMRTKNGQLKTSG
jgi:tetratricopeptide (TPR) repeat protein